MFNSKRYFSRFSPVKYWSSKKTISNKSITAPFTAIVLEESFHVDHQRQRAGRTTETGHGAGK